MDTFPADTDAYERTLDLPPRKERGWVHEVEVPMRAGEPLAYETSHPGASGRVEFNIHSHHGRETTYHVKGSDATMRGTFTAPADGKFYLMWENTSDGAVRVKAVARRRT